VPDALKKIFAMQRKNVARADHILMVKNMLRGIDANDLHYLPYDGNTVNAEVARMLHE